MAATPQLISPTAEIKLINNPGVEISGYRIQAGMNNFPTVQIFPHPKHSADKQTIGVADADVMRFLEYTQTQKLSKLSQLYPSSDVVLTLTDGLGNNLKMAALISAPSPILASDYYSLAFDCIHESAIVSSLQTNIYATPEFVATQPTRSDNTKVKVPLSEFAAESLATRMSVVLSAMQAQWKIHKDNALHEFSLPSNIPIATLADKNNTTPLDIWYRILQDSTTSTVLSTIAPLAGKKAEDFGSNVALFNLLIRIYKESGSNFLSAMLNFSGMFQMMYAPSLNATATAPYGKFISFENLYENDFATARTADILQLSPALGYSDLAPVQQVMVKGHYLPGSHRNDKQAAGQPSVLAAWPAAVVTTGRIMDSAPPVWLDLTNQTSLTAPASDPSAGPRNILATLLTGGMYLLALDQWKSRAAAAVNSVNASRLNILTAWARTDYVVGALMSERMSIVTSLDFNWEIGKRYHVSSKPSSTGAAQSKLFTGTVTGLAHDYRRNNEKVTASTQVEFSFVEVGNFVLPNKK